MPTQLFFTNVPCNCSDREFKEWIESRGFEVRSVRMIRDLVAGVSPAFAYADMKDATRLEEAVSVLNGKKMRDRTITVRQMPEQSVAASSPKFFTARRAI